MLRKKYLIISVLCLLMGITASAQTPESFFPHHVGDTWQYTLDNTNIIYGTDIIVADSTDSIGGHYLKYQGHPGYKYYIDTSHNVFSVNAPYHH